MLRGGYKKLPVVVAIDIEMLMVEVRLVAEVLEMKDHRAEETGKRHEGGVTTSPKC